MELFVGNLPREATPEDLTRLFHGYGDASGFVIVRRSLPDGRQLRFGYGVITPDREAVRAIRERHLHPYKGNFLFVLHRMRGDFRNGIADAVPGHNRELRLAGPARERRAGERRAADRRAGDRRRYERRINVHRLSGHPFTEPRYNEHRIAERRVAERRAIERRAGERRNTPD